MGTAGASAACCCLVSAARGGFHCHHCVQTGMKAELFLIASSQNSGTFACGRFCDALP